MAGTSAMNGEAISATSPMVQTAAQQDGSRRATANPSRTDASSFPPRPAGGASRTKARATTTARKDTALASKATG